MAKPGQVCSVGRSWPQPAALPKALPKRTPPNAGVTRPSTVAQRGGRWYLLEDTHHAAEKTRFRRAGAEIHPVPSSAGSVLGLAAQGAAREGVPPSGSSEPGGGQSARGLGAKRAPALLEEKMAEGLGRLPHGIERAHAKADGVQAVTLPPTGQKGAVLPPLTHWLPHLPSLKCSICLIPRWGNSAARICPNCVEPGGHRGPRLDDLPMTPGRQQWSRPQPKVKGHSVFKAWYISLLILYGYSENSWLSRQSTSLGGR